MESEILHIILFRSPAFYDAGSQKVKEKYSDKGQAGAYWCKGSLVRFPNCKWVGEPDFLVPRLTRRVGRGT